MKKNRIRKFNTAESGKASTVSQSNYRSEDDQYRNTMKHLRMNGVSGISYRKMKMMADVHVKMKAGNG